MECFHHDLQEYTETESCTNNVTVDKTTRVDTNQKPWMTSKTLLKKWNSACKSGDKAQYSVARAELWRAIEGAKEAHKTKLEGLEMLCSGRDYRPSPTTKGPHLSPPADTTLAAE